MTDPDPLAVSAAQVRLITFHREGTPVRAPRGVVQDGYHLLVKTDAPTGKVKPVRNAPRSRVARCDPHGQVKPGATDPAEMARTVNRRR